MTQKAPERIFAEFGYDMQRGSFWGHPSDQSIEYLHIDHALDLVAAEREACASIAEECFAPGSEEEVAGEVIAASIRARTDDDAQAALEARDKRIRNETLREVISKLAPILDIVGEFGAQAYYLMDDCETTGSIGSETHTVTDHGLRAVNDILDKIDDLPFSEPGYELGTGAKLKAAIRQTIEALITEDQSDE